MRIGLMLVSLSLILIVGCQNNATVDEEPFIFSYSLNNISVENESEVHRWLEDVKADEQSRIHSLGTIDGYEYFYAKGYSDASVTYQMQKKAKEDYRVIKANFKKGNEVNEVLIEVKYNPLVCCDGTVINDSYTGE
ncbi:hypothetical protein IM538_13800 [Cytobacillus suaedae]|nr:hypothetical protein IM538_13800 [Cytobacillus suaedae]